jgi:hypothetical protein
MSVPLYPLAFMAADGSAFIDEGRNPELVSFSSGGEQLGDIIIRAGGE